MSQNLADGLRADRAPGTFGAARRRRDRRLRAFLKHERVTVAMNLATIQHHSYMKAAVVDAGVQVGSPLAPVAEYVAQKHITRHLGVLISLTSDAIIGWYFILHLFAPSHRHHHHPTSTHTSAQVRASRQVSFASISKIERISASFSAPLSPSGCSAFAGKRCLCCDKEPLCCWLADCSLQPCRWPGSRTASCEPAPWWLLSCPCELERSSLPSNRHGGSQHEPVG